MTETSYPAWRRNLDIYQAWNGKNIPISVIAARFNLDYKSTKRAIDTIGDLLYQRGRHHRSFEDLEATFILVSKHAPEKDVTKLTKLIFAWFPTLEEFYQFNRDWSEIPGVGPKYVALLKDIQKDTILKDLHVRISYRTYLKLRKYAEMQKKTVSWIVETSVENFVEV